MKTISRRKANTRFLYSALVILAAIVLYSASVYFIFSNNTHPGSAPGVLFIAFLAATMVTLGHINQWD